MGVQEIPGTDSGAVPPQTAHGAVEDLGRGGHGLLVGLAGRIGKGLAPLVDFALPPRCPGCGTVVAGDGRFCTACWTGLDWLTGSGCARCALPVAAAAEGGLCGPCLADPPAFDALRAAVLYSPIAARVAMRLKYGRKPGAAAVMARALERHVRAEAAPLLVPVPLHRGRLWSRGFNQSVMIGRALVRATGAAMAVDAVERVRATPPLRGLSAGARRRATAGAFRIGPGGGAVAGRRVMLVDDVCTSGATADACARVLKRAGATGVVVLCWARVAPGDDCGNREWPR